MSCKLDLTANDLLVLSNAVDAGIKECGRVIAKGRGNTLDEYTLVDIALEDLDTLRKLHSKLDDYGEANIKGWGNNDD